MTDTRYAEAMRRVLDATAAAMAEVDAAVPRPRYSRWRRILWKFTGVPYEVSYEARRIGKERADLYFAAMRRARDTLAGSTDEWSPRTRTRKREKAAKHAPRFAMKVPQHEGSLNVYFVHDCACGWQSPLCPTAERAEEAFDQHRGAA